MTTALATTAAFLDLLYGDDAPGWLSIFSDDDVTRWWSAERSSEAATTAQAINQDHDVWYGVGLRATNLGPGRRGGLFDIAALPGFWIDIDIAGPAHAQAALPGSFNAAQTLLWALPLEPSLVVHSGHGLQAYWLFKELYVFESDVERQRVEAMSRRWQALVRQLAQARGWTLDNTSDLARLLRLPGTFNRKLEPVQVYIIERADNARYDLGEIEELLPDEVALGWVAPDVPTNDGDFPPAYLERILPQCAWLQHTVDDAATLREPEWYAQAGIVGRCVDGARQFHEISATYPRYSADETERKLQHALKASSARTCAYIRSELGGESFCAQCRHWGAIKTPLVLGRPPEPTLILLNGNGHGSEEIPPAEGQVKQNKGGISLEDFRAYMPEHKYIFIPSRELWPASSVNARIGPVDIGGSKEPAAKWLDRNRPVEQMTWAPGEPDVIVGRLLSNGGWIQRDGVSAFNLYRASTMVPGDASSAAPWVRHIHRIYPSEADHILDWLAHRVQYPNIKTNHALVLGGAQGIGKDTLLEPVKYAIGPWNFQEVSPLQLIGRFNSFIKSVILRVSEARDLGDLDRYSFYEHLKMYTAAPPDVLRCDEKNIREYSVLNVCGVIITTNHKSDGIYLPADDRRHYVAWSEATSLDFDGDYWNSLYEWYEHGGYADVAAYLASRDLELFDAKAPPPKTQAFWAIVDASRAPEDAELADALDKLMYPDATTINQIIYTSDGDFAEWLRDRKNRRQIPHRMESAGYVPVRNDAAADGLWRVGSKRQVVYSKREMSLRDRIASAQALTGG